MLYMFFLFIVVLALIAFGCFGLEFLLKMRALRSQPTGGIASRLPVPAADRYRPMLRLLSNDDLAFVSADSKMQRTLRVRRRNLFRGYLRCLTADYARLLAGVREVMVHSGVDRPDLARALAKNRVHFAIAICKVEFRLALHTTGVGNVDISGLVDALDALRGQVSALSASSGSMSSLTA
jgi:hypothetical protein